MSHSLEKRRTASIANLTPMVRGFEEGRPCKPISPELALVDPELARLALAFDSRPEVSDVLSTAAAIHTPPVGGFRARVSRPAALLLLVALVPAAVLVPWVASRIDESTEHVPSVRPRVGGNDPASPGKTGRPSGPSDVDAGRAPSRAKRPAPKPRRSAFRTVLGETRATAERHVLTALVQSPVGNLPSQLIDRRTGLPANNVQAVCRPQGRSFLCVVRPRGHARGEGIRVRYTPTRDGRGVMRWYRYRER